MAEKKKIKSIKDNTGSGDGATITVGDISSPTSGTGGTAVATTPDQTFEQANFKALCFNVGDIVNTEAIIVTGSDLPVIVSARRIQRGTVLTTVDNNSGTIEENKSKKVINFSHTFLKENKIVPGSEVKYDIVQDFKTGGEIAVNVEIQP